MSLLPLYAVYPLQEITKEYAPFTLCRHPKRKNHSKKRIIRKEAMRKVYIMTKYALH